MADTIRTLSALQTLLADNTAGDISPQDMRDLLVSAYPSNERQHNLEFGKTTTDTPDDDFDAGSLDGKWTAVSGSSGTVDILSTTGSTYDFTTRSDMLLMQGYNGAAVELRQDYTLPDGNSIVCCVSPSFLGDVGITNNEIICGIGLNDSTTTVFVTNASNVAMDCQTSAVQIFHASSLSTFGRSFGAEAIGGTIYFRIARATLTYTGFYSYDGATWVPMGQTTKAGALDRLWIYMQGLGGTPGNPKPVSAFKWIRQGSNSLDPW